MTQLADAFTIVAKGLYLEGLAVDADSGTLWYSDVIAGGIHGQFVDGRTQVLNPERMWTGGIMLNDDGRVLSSGQGGIMWNDPATGESGWLINSINGKPLNGINEMTPDGHGGIYFGTIDLDSIVRGEPAGKAAIGRMTVDGEVMILADDISFTNGLVRSMDGKKLFFNESFVSTYAFDVLPDGTLGERNLLLEKVDCDGMALDAEGNVLVTGFRSSAISRVRPDGTVLDAIETPGGAITQIRFSGGDNRDYYIATVPADMGDQLAVGKLPETEQSFIYKGRAVTPGVPQGKSRFRMR